MSREVPKQHGGLRTPSFLSPLPSSTCDHLGTRAHSSELAVAGCRPPLLSRVQKPSGHCQHWALTQPQPALFPQQRKKVGRGAECEGNLCHHVTVSPGNITGLNL